MIRALVTKLTVIEASQEIPIPVVNTGPRAQRTRLGHFVAEVGYSGFDHYVRLYRTAMAQLPQWSACLDVPTDFGPVRVYRFDGPSGPAPVVLLPGRNAATPMWRPNLAALITRRTVYAVDLLGEAGLSVQQRPIAAPQDHAAWLDDTVRGLGLAHVHLMGASIGGWAAACYAIHRPGRAVSVTLLDPVMTFDGIPVRTLLWSAAMITPGVPTRLRDTLLSRVVGVPIPKTPDTALIAAATTDFVLRLPPPRRLTPAQVHGIDIPVLAVLGGRSTMLHPARAAETADAVLRHGQVLVWQAASHALSGEYPELLAEQAHRFWDDTGR